MSDLHQPAASNECAVGSTRFQGLHRRLGRVSRRRLLAWSGMACLIGIALYSFSPLMAAPSATPAQNKPSHKRIAPVLAAAVKKDALNIYLHGLGSVTPMNTAVVKARVGGQLTNTAFREGDTVKKGDLLAKIDPRPYKIQLEAAEGELAKSQALLSHAKSELKRYQLLYRQDSIAKQQMEAQQSLVSQYEGNVKAHKAERDEAKLQLSYARIVAPIDGRLGLRQLDQGNLIEPNDSRGLVVITQLKPIGVVFSLPEDTIPAIMERLQAGDKIMVEAFDRSRKRRLAKGSLMTIDNQIDPATGTVKLKARFGNKKETLFPHQFVNIRMLLAVQPDAIVIPSAGVQHGSKGSFVYVIKPDQTVTIRSVKLGAVQGNHTAIETGLAPGELVVIDGADRLREGMQVKVSLKEVKRERPEADEAADDEKDASKRAQRRQEPAAKDESAGAA